MALALPHPAIVGVLNVTPDSFSDGGRWASPDAALERARVMADHGADIVEIGGESTAPARRALTAEAELERIEAVVARAAPLMPVSIDTYHARTAARCLELGAVAVNDVSALRAEPDLARVVAGTGALLVLMHAKDGPLPHVSDAPRAYADLVAEVADFLRDRAAEALAAGVDERCIVLDPGAGRFLSHDPDDSWRLLEGFARLVELLKPFRVMVATSRKGFIGLPLGERDPVSQLTGLVAATRGASFIRTHDSRMAHQFVAAARHMGLLPAEGRFGGGGTVAAPPAPPG